MNKQSSFFRIAVLIHYFVLFNKSLHDFTYSLMQSFQHFVNFLFILVFITHLKVQYVRILIVEIHPLVVKC